MTQRLANLLLAVVAGCAPGSGAGLGAPGPGGSPFADDIVRIGGYAWVDGVALSRTRAFVVAGGGVAIYDRIGERWLPPVTLHAPDRRRSDPVTVAAEAYGDAVWIAEGARIWLVRVSTRQVVETAVGGQVREIGLDPRGLGAWVRADQWWFISASGGGRPVSMSELPPRDSLSIAPTSAELLDRTPGLRSFAGLLVRDSSLTSWRMTSLAATPEQSQVWAGTDGGGVFRLDPQFLRSAQLPFGMRGQGAVALAPAADGVWIAELGAERNTGAGSLTFGSDDLQRWRWISPGTLSSRINAVTFRGSDACLATDHGAVITDIGSLGSDASRRLATGITGPAHAVIATPAGCWVAHAGGTTLLPWTPGVVSDARGRELPGVDATAFAASGDTLWLGTSTGLRMRVGTDLPESALGELPAPLRGRIVALALTADGLAVATDRELWLTHAPLRAGGAVRPNVPVERIAPLRAVASDSASVWIVGARGAIAWSIARGEWRAVAVESALDAGRLDGAAVAAWRDGRAIVLRDGLAWIATRGGLLRVRRGADGMPR